jgi:hypothetical protein
MMNSAPTTTNVVTAVAVTAGFEGLRAGAGTFRVLLDLPARARIGPLAFADLSRATDLSTTGLVFYAVFGFGGALLTGLTWFLAMRHRAPTMIRRLLAVSVVASLLVLVFTTQAAPLMWRVGAAPADPALIAELLDRFTAWTVARIVCVDISFAAALAALTLLAWPRGRAT